MKVLVIIPTYNERENISRLLPALMGVKESVNVLVVDDSSPDGTSEVVKQNSNFEKRVHLLSRPKKSGLGKAYLAGFTWALENNFDLIIEMDADFSHRPEDLEKILTQKNNADFLIGSRYVPGGKTVNWGLIRKFISRFGSFYSRMVLGFPVRDWTGGFNFWHRRVLQSIQLNSIESSGYCFQIELKYRALKKNWKYLEVPITFEDRRVGQSKMSSKIVIEALYKVWKVRAWRA